MIQLLDIPHQNLEHNEDFLAPKKVLRNGMIPNIRNANIPSSILM